MRQFLIIWFLVVGSISVPLIGHATTKTMCAGQVPHGWIITNYWKSTSSCPGIAETYRIEKYINKPIGYQMNACISTPPQGWVIVKEFNSLVKCGRPRSVFTNNMMTIERLN
ncbi:MAG: hypothetical protein OXI01_24190 [Albidovulum sp.]|nr:hypothetical protein [Albidovulum sp.]